MAKSLVGDDTARSTGKEEIREEHFGKWGRHEETDDLRFSSHIDYATGVSEVSRYDDQRVNYPIRVLSLEANKRASLNVCQLILWYELSVVYIYTYVYTCMRACALSWLAILFYSHLESTHLASQSQQISPAQQSVHPLQTATGPAMIVNGDDKRPFNHIQTYR